MSFSLMTSDGERKRGFRTVFVELGKSMRASSPFRHTLVITLANDVDFYMPTRRIFEEASYEITTCPMEPGCGEAQSAAAPLP